MRSILESLFAGLTLTQADAFQLMEGLIEGAFPNEQVAALLACYRMRVPTAAEVMGFRESVLKRANQLDLDAADALDMVGTGGDGKDTFNITTLSALTVAACGYRVLKHGNSSASSKHGSSDTLKAAGYSFRQNPYQVQRQLDSANISFLHAPLFHPALGNVAPLRRALGVGTLFNLLGPLVNPSQPKYNFIGVADARVQGLYAQVFDSNKLSYAIVHSNDGYDEVTLTGPVRSYSNRGRATLQPRDFGLPPTSAESIQVEDDATAQFLRILAGYGSVEETNTVAANAGLAIHLRENQTQTLDHYVDVARETLLSGRVSENFKKLCAV